jgi:hypothetical protein
MMKSPVEGWSDARFKNWIISLLRRGTLRFPNRSIALEKAKRGKMRNRHTGRMAEHYECFKCGILEPLSHTHVDHNPPVVCPKTGFVNFDTYIERMFAPPKVWRVSCKPCHAKITGKETKQRVKERAKRKKNV